MTDYLTRLVARGAGNDTGPRLRALPRLYAPADQMGGLVVTDAEALAAPAAPDRALVGDTAAPAAPLSTARKEDRSDRPAAEPAGAAQQPPTLASPRTMTEALFAAIDETAATPVPSERNIARSRHVVPRSATLEGERKIVRDITAPPDGNAATEAGLEGEVPMLPDASSARATPLADQFLAPLDAPSHHLPPPRERERLAPPSAPSISIGRIDIAVAPPPRPPADPRTRGFGGYAGQRRGQLR